MSLTIQDFINKHKIFTIWDYTFREPNVKTTMDLQWFYKQALEKNINEFDFYIDFLEKLLVKWDKDKFKLDVLEMPMEQATKFFFYILEQLGINFQKAPTQSE